MSSTSPIGVFDSGIGGLSILRALREALPSENFVYLADSGHAPYGERGAAYVIDRSRAIAAYLRERYGIKALVVACNTATAAAIQLLRAEHPDLPLVGVEPALKPAAAVSRTRRIGVMGTEGTLASAKFRALLDSLADQAEFVLQPCPGLADAIETGSEAKTAALCTAHLQAMGRFGLDADQMDTLVLGCTHYPFAAEAIAACLPPGVQLIEPGDPVARQTARLVRHAHAQRSAGTPSSAIRLLSTGTPALLQAAAARWLGLQQSAQALRLPAAK